MLLARVTQVKRKGEVVYVGLETGMNSLIRPALYGAYHPIVNLTRLDEPATLIAHVVGPICETGDILGRSRRLAARAGGGRPPDRQRRRLRPGHELLVQPARARRGKPCCSPG